MEKRWKQEEVGMFDLEPARAFADAAFTQDDDLAAGAERIRNGGPFLESNPHKNKTRGNGPALVGANLS